MEAMQQLVSALQLCRFIRDYVEVLGGTNTFERDKLRFPEAPIRVQEEK